MSAQVFLGVNLKCASCHDSFIDDWKLADSWGLAAIIADHPLEIYRCDVPTGKTAAPAFLFPELGSIDPQLPRKERLEQLSRLITDPHNGRLPRTLVNRLWQRLIGRGIVNPVDAMDAAPWSPELLDYLAAELVESGYDVKKLLRLIATSKIYQAQCVPPPESLAGDAPAFSGPDRTPDDGGAISRRRLANHRRPPRISRTRPMRRKCHGTFDPRGQRTDARCDHEMRSC